MIFNGDTNGQEMILDIPSEYIEEGNKLLFAAEERWSPREYGQEDPSNYTFSVANIWFDKL